MEVANNRTTYKPTENITVNGLNCTVILDIDKSECLYPYIANMTVLDTYTFVLYLPVNIFIAMLGLFGNTLAYVVMSKDMESTCSTICLKALAVADNMVLVTFGSYFALPTLWQYMGVCYQCTAIQELAKPYLWAGMWFSKTLSIYIIVQMTIERFIAVCMPLRALNWCTKTAARRGILVIVILDVVYNLPKIFQWRTDYSCDPCTGQLQPKTELADMYNNTVFRILYTKCMYYIIMFVFPLTVLSFLNVRLIMSIRKATTFRRSSVSQVSSDDNATEKIIAVVLSFLILETPSLMYNVLTIFRDHTNHREMGIDWKTIGVVMRSLYIISMVNSFINFYIYCVVGRRFRRGLWRMLICRRRKRRLVICTSVRNSLTTTTINTTESYRFIVKKI